MSLPAPAGNLTGAKVPAGCQEDHNKASPTQIPGQKVKTERGSEFRVQMTRSEMASSKRLYLHPRLSAEVSGRSKGPAMRKAEKTVVSAASKRISPTIDGGIYRAQPYTLLPSAFADSMLPGFGFNSLAVIGSSDMIQPQRHTCSRISPFSQCKRTIQTLRELSQQWQMIPNCSCAVQQKPKTPRPHDYCARGDLEPALERMRMLLYDKASRRQES
ncbi:hypothetical protein C8R45DRAFT_1069915 [Mycena sanguinolenta]|nr:hypothetical protein C8R45DRAFT_1069915 [Mycena sanguinolenta]